MMPEDNGQIDTGSFLIDALPEGLLDPEEMNSFMKIARTASPEEFIGKIAEAKLICCNGELLSFYEKRSKEGGKSSFHYN